MGKNQEQATVPDDRVQLGLLVSRKLKKRLKLAAIDKGLSMQAYLEQVLTQALPEESGSA